MPEYKSHTRGVRKTSGVVLKSKQCISAALLLFVSGHAIAGLFTSDGDTFEECMENRIDETKTVPQYAIAEQYCRQKHPAPAPAPAKNADWVQAFPDPTFHLFKGTDPQNIVARPAISALSMMNFAVTSDYRGAWYGRVDITNRNRFPVSSIVVGIPAKGGQCSWNESLYAEIYKCDGQADIGMTGSFRCDIPGIEKKPRAYYCVIGLGVWATPADLKQLSLVQ
jgi:hypothetical protein